MRNKIIITVLALSTFIIGCTTGGYDEPFTLSDVGFYTSEGTEQVLQKNIYDYMSFADLSQGVTSHSWTIEKGNAFLKGPIPRNPSNLEKLIINEGDTVSNADIINVFFRKSGMQKIRLYNEFNDSVAFRGNRGGVDYELHSEKLGNKWVIDTTFIVKVFDTIVPEIIIKQDGIIRDHTANDTIYVEAGGTLNFIDNTTIGEPTGRNWYVRTPIVIGDAGSGKNIINRGEKDATIILKKLGVFVGGINAFRTGQNIPSDYERYEFPAPIKVIPSSKPFELSGNIRELEDETIQVPFNGEFEPLTGQEAFFEVKVNGNVFEIESVAVSDSDATLINIKLKEPIYRPDVITVTFLAGSGLSSTDSRTPITFTDKPVVMHNVNIIPTDIAGFEDTTSWQGFAPAWGENQGLIEYSTTIKYKGNQSIKLTSVNGQRSAIEAYLPNPISYDPDLTYIMRFAMYVESSTVLPSEVSLWQLGEWKSLWVSPDQPKGEWKTFELEFKGWNPLARLYLRILPNANSDYVAYIDDIFIVTKEVRI